jgi:hypothetical protein
MRNIYIILGFVLVMLGACANRGQGPQGGPRDSIPPMVVKETPQNWSLNVQSKSIEIVFDEYIQLADVQKNVLISPPQQVAPEIKAIGKKVTVALQEDLIDSTTYTIDFGSAICDYNEKVPLDGYVFAFSTGDVIDSLIIKGRVVDAETLNPVAGVLVGIHQNIEDSALSTLPFTRVTRTNEMGRFALYNVRAGKYRLYALDDVSRDYLYQPGEALAFLDTIVEPSFEVHEHTDTIWRDSIGLSVYGDTVFTRVLDSTYTHMVTHFYPDSLVLWHFLEAKQRHYFKGVYREEQHVFSLHFSAAQDSMPLIRALRPSEIDSLNNDSAWVNFLDYSLLQTSVRLDTINYWLTDSLAIGMDSIYLEMTYLVTDSVYNLVSQTDTVLAVFRHPRLSEKAREVYERNKRERKLQLKSNASRKFDIYDTLWISSAFPIDSIFEDKIHLSVKVDSTWKNVAFEIGLQDTLAMRVNLLAKLQPEAIYMLKIDSAGIKDIYGVGNDSLKWDVKLKSLNDYSILTVKLVQYDSLARIQLLDEKDKVIAEQAALAEGTKFEYLAPTAYYLRLYIDKNGDGKWTTGDWLTKRQPEPMYYYPNKLKLRANWEFEENFDHLALPQENSKPVAIVSGSKKKR